jgi:hypothetical protein
MTTRRNNTPTLPVNGRPYGIDETAADEHLLIVNDLDADMYGEHAKGKHPEQLTVWELYGPYQGKHRK